MPDVTIDFALLLYDDFDGTPIRDANIIFRHEGRIVTPLRKREGFYVFCNLSGSEPELEINRPHYHRKLKRIIKNRLDPGNPVVSIRLIRKYPGNFSDCDWLHGTGPPGGGVCAVSSVEIPIRQQTGDDGACLLSILGSTAARLVGKRFAVDAKSGETFLITRMTAPGMYLVQGAFPTAPKAARHMMRAYLSRIGSDGCWQIPVEFGHNDAMAGMVYHNDGGDSQWDSVS